jgi:transketolase
MPMTISRDLRLAIEADRRRYGQKSIRQQYGETLLALAGISPELLVVTADLMYATGIEEFGRLFPDRLINVGIAEQNMAGIAAGLALSGRPVIACGYAAFTTLRAVEQAKLDAAYNGAKVIMTGQSAGLSYSVGGPTHQTFEDVAIMRAIPNTVVVVPSDAAEVDLCLRAALALEIAAPIYVRLGRGPEYNFSDPGGPFHIGSAKTLRSGNDIAFVANGAMVFEAILAADHLAARGIAARVINTHTVKPLDRNVLVAAAREVAAIIVIEEHSVLGGLGGAVAEALSETRGCPVRLLGIADAFPPIGPVFELRESLGLSAAHLVLHAEQMLAGVSREAVS